MSKLLLIPVVMVGIGVATIDPPAQTARAVPKADGISYEPAVTPVAYRPGEPMLIPGQATELRRAADGHFYADAQVNGFPVPMLVDTGASTVALTIGDAQRLGITVDPASFEVVGAGASGPVRGARVVLDSVAIGGRHEGPIAAVVLEGLDRSLLGQSWLGRLDQVQITGDTMTLR